MHLWNTRALAEKIKRDELTEAEKLKYFIFLLITTIIVMELPSSETGYSFYHLLSLGFQILVGVLCVVGNFKTNVQNNGKDFITRYLLLSVPISIKLIVLILGVAIALVTVVEVIPIPVFQGLKFIYEPVTPQESFVSEMLNMVPLYLLVYWRMNVNLRFINED